MSIVEDTGPRMPRIGQASAEDQQMLREVFSTLLERAASNGGSLFRRDIERVRTEFSPDEGHRFERYSDAHNAIIATLRNGAAGLPHGLFDYLVELYAGDVIDDLYPGLCGEAGAVWREIVLEEIETLMRDWLVPGIDARLGAAYGRLAAEQGERFRGEDIVGDDEIIGTFRAANRRLDEELRAGAEFGRVLSLAVNGKVRQMLGQEATRSMFIGKREADTILENLVGAQYGNRFRMTVVDPA
jgi:hypothetical protein